MGSEACHKSDKFEPRQTTIGKELDNVVDALANSEVFRVVSHDDLEFLATLFQRRDFADAEAICHRGDEAKEFYVIKDGQVEITIHPDGPVVGTFFRSAVIGEYAIFTESSELPP